VFASLSASWKPPTPSSVNGLASTCKPTAKPLPRFYTMSLRRAWCNALFGGGNAELRRKGVFLVLLILRGQVGNLWTPLLIPRIVRS